MLVLLGIIYIWESQPFLLLMMRHSYNITNSSLSTIISDRNFEQCGGTGRRTAKAGSPFPGGNPFPPLYPSRAVTNLQKSVGPLLLLSREKIGKCLVGMVRGVGLPMKVGIRQKPLPDGNTMAPSRKAGIYDRFKGESHRGWVNVWTRLVCSPGGRRDTRNNKNALL